MAFAVSRRFSFPVFAVTVFLVFVSVVRVGCRRVAVKSNRSKPKRKPNRHFQPRFREFPAKTNQAKQKVCRPAKSAKPNLPNQFRRRDFLVCPTQARLCEFRSYQKAGKFPRFCICRFYFINLAVFARSDR